MNNPSDIKFTQKTVKWIVRAAVLIFLLIVGLRFYASRLEQNAIGLTRSVEELQAEEMSLKQELAALMSPNRIFDYCRDKLGMKRATDIVVIKNEN